VMAQFLQRPPKFQALVEVQHCASFPPSAFSGNARRGFLFRN
jgi:hypothetical protein